MSASSPRTVLLTGGTSALGWATALRLARAGDEVLLAVRKPARRGLRERVAELRATDPETAGSLRLIDCDLAQEDVLDPAARERVVQDCAGIVHVAADRRSDGVRRAVFDVNVRATRALLRLAQELDGRFVHVSDLDISGDARGVWMEDQLLDGQELGGDPVRESRMLAERHVRKAMGEQSAVVVRCALPVGPRDGVQDPVWTLLGRLRDLSRWPLPGPLRRLPFVPGGGRRLHALPVDDLAAVVAAAWADDGPGTVHAADPFAPTLAEWVAAASAALGLAPPGRSAPGRFAIFGDDLPVRCVAYDTTHADALLRRNGLRRPSWREGIALLIGSM